MMGPSTHAVVFDCDGLLLDTEPCWERAERGLLDHLGGTWDGRIRTQTRGTSVEATAVLLTRIAGADLPVDDGVRMLEARFEAEFVRDYSNLLMPGATDLMDVLTGTSLAVASNTPLPILERLLRASGLRERFTAVVGAGGAIAPKPAPDVYTAACRALGAPPDTAHALEDSQPGVDAARGAGLKVTGVNSDPGTELTGCRRVLTLHALMPGAAGKAGLAHG